MDTELKCNRLTCRKSLSDKAVVTTCSHIFCVDCANELFNVSRLCPACESQLSEPDDVVICSLHPSNDYKTSVLSGLAPSIILEICSRAISFWQYQIHQENAFQQAVLRNLNDKCAQLQKQLDSVVREANGEIALLNSKRAELELDLENEKRKVRDLQEANKEQEKEYQKLKVQHDKMKRKTVLAPSLASVNAPANQVSLEESRNLRAFTANMANTVDIGAVVGGMEANGIQRTPIVNRTGTYPGPQRRSSGEGGWTQSGPVGPHVGQQRVFGRPGFPPKRTVVDQSNRSGYTSDHSDSANEVENLLVGSGGAHYSNRVSSTSGWQASSVQRQRPVAAQPQRVFANHPAKRASGTFRPAVITGHR
ncbi:e3 ubiquitin-protein ligase ccnb1ip1 [Moniliophthora roreri MCA 2997]|uniref:E3 ubiquitin-protein ligase ccnb1ip1 n=2 Tax=Moniliophthora roreri TaxID=221103 RepID=V2YQ03_MONRO|nr:e3 ubiquitin-protein ligase ccnb1ip1 [Moniliophthora roreri MCA 2997]